MKLSGITEHRHFRTVLGAVLVAFVGIAFWAMPLGEGCVNASYDYLFRFGSRVVTNKVVLVLMDNNAYNVLHQSRGAWDRELHAKLLDKLAADRCPLVVFDVFFRAADPRSQEADRQLEAAIKRAPCVALMARQAELTHPNLRGVTPEFPWQPFQAAARTNWGVASLEPDRDGIVRRHWPFPSPHQFPSLPWTAARLAGAKLDEEPRERWLRYYGEEGSWSSLSYPFALTKATNYFRDKIVFVGNKPESPLLDSEKDEFEVPYSRWTKEAVGGMEILATEFLNLMNRDWLRRPGWPMELLMFAFTGACLGGGLCQLRRAYVAVAAIAVVLLVTIGAVLLSHLTNYWVPWLVIIAVQLPCGLAWALWPAKVPVPARVAPKGTIVLSFPDQDRPETPDYELFEPPLGEGGFGKVWLVKNAVGQYQALKAVYQSKFGDNPGPYEAEFKGLQNYKPISEKHPGLLRIDLVSRKKGGGYFYYVMELGDSQTTGWQQNPALYKAKDLESLRREADGRRLPLPECVRIGTILADALDFLHRQGFTHRDIKPSNIIFVDGRPKLADVGLVTTIRRPEDIVTWVGTPGYMPPPPERPGTAQADIYALGMVLYVISTGRDPDFFHGLTTTLMQPDPKQDFQRLSTVILKACNPDTAVRYPSTSELLQALQQCQAEQDKTSTGYTANPA